MTEKEIIARIEALPGIERPNDMQFEVLRSKVRDIILIAPTGSGKTLAFGARILSRTGAPAGYTQAVVIAPSRELVMQIASVMRQLARGYKTVELYGGHSVADETASLEPVPDIIVATPGRLLDHLQRGTLKPGGSLEMLVLDEYDKSLQLGFEGEMKRIVRRLPKPGNIVLTSATRLAELPQYLGIENPEIIEAGPTAEKEGKLETIRVESFSRDKLDTLSELLKTFAPDSKTIVFVNHRESAERVWRRLRDDGISAGLYHGALDQQQRVMAVDMLANGTTPVLVATDLAARGLDIEAVESVIHYHIPVDGQTWTHRNGRTARQDASGSVYVITSEADTLPDYMEFNRDYQPRGGGEASPSDVATLYFAAGKKEKISRGDIAGFILSNTDLDRERLGKITVHDHFSLAAVPRSMSRSLVETLNRLKIKGKKVRITQVKI